CLNPTRSDAMHIDGGHTPRLEPSRDGKAGKCTSIRKRAPIDHVDNAQSPGPRQRTKAPQQSASNQKPPTPRPRQSRNQKTPGTRPQGNKTPPATFPFPHKQQCQSKQTQ